MGANWGNTTHLPECLKFSKEHQYQVLAKIYGATIRSVNWSTTSDNYLASSTRLNSYTLWPSHFLLGICPTDRHTCVHKKHRSMIYNGPKWTLSREWITTLWYTYIIHTRQQQEWTNYNYTVTITTKSVFLHVDTILWTLNSELLPSFKKKKWWGQILPYSIRTCFKSYG